LLVTPAIAEVPALVILPMAKGLLAVGRTRTFCQVSLQVAPELAVLTVNVSWVEVTEVMGPAAPLTIPFIFAGLLPVALIRSILTVGATPPVSKMKPVGALRMIVPFPTSPE